MFDGNWTTNFFSGKDLVNRNRLQYTDYLLALAWFQSAYIITLTVWKLFCIDFAMSAKAAIVWGIT